MVVYGDGAVDCVSAEEMRCPCTTLTFSVGLQLQLRFPDCFCAKLGKLCWPEPFLFFPFVVPVSGWLFQIISRQSSEFDLPSDDSGPVNL